MQNLEKLEIGQKYQGGVIAYIFRDGDPGYDPNVQHGLIAALCDQAQNVPWWTGSNLITESGDALGSGKLNTTIIINEAGEYWTAAKECQKYTGGGYTDWFLPSKEIVVTVLLGPLDISKFSRAVAGAEVPSVPLLNRVSLLIFNAS